jgi:hypothetical protein
MIQDLKEVDNLILDIDQKYKIYTADSVLERFDAITTLQSTIEYQEQIIEAYKSRIKNLENQLEI